eukprot:6204319-Pleurochrysis_carterae.AAC.2
MSAPSSLASCVASPQLTAMGEMKPPASASLLSSDRSAAEMHSAPTGLASTDGSESRRSSERGSIRTSAPSCRSKAASSADKT